MPGFICFLSISVRNFEGLPFVSSSNLGDGSCKRFKMSLPTFLSDFSISSSTTFSQIENIPTLASTSSLLYSILKESIYLLIFQHMLLYLANLSSRTKEPISGPSHSISLLIMLVILLILLSLYEYLCPITGLGYSAILQ